MARVCVHVMTRLGPSTFTLTFRKHPLKKDYYLPSNRESMSARVGETKYGYFAMHYRLAVVSKS